MSRRYFGPHDEMRPCPECAGHGRLDTDTGPAPRTVDCDWCGGDGLIPDFTDLDERKAA